MWPFKNWKKDLQEKINVQQFNINRIMLEIGQINGKIRDIKVAVEELEKIDCEEPLWKMEVAENGERHIVPGYKRVICVLSRNSEEV